MIISTPSIIFSTPFKWMEKVEIFIKSVKMQVENVEIFDNRVEMQIENVEIG
jgi:hypothetical protein